MKQEKFFGMYRGIVVKNDNTEIPYQNKIKVFIPGIYPETLASDYSNLPWAEIVSSFFGGGWKNERADEDENQLNKETGWCSVPKSGENLLEGAQVWCFLESGDQNYPKIFAVSQNGTSEKNHGWFTEHPKQEAFKSDNITIRIDENQADDRSTCKFDSYNKNCTYLSKKSLLINEPTLLDIQIRNPKLNAINLQITGNINIKHIGNKFEETFGDIHTSHFGNHFLYHEGSTHHVQMGDTTHEKTGKLIEKIVGDQVITIEGDINRTRTGNSTFMTSGNMLDTTVGWIKKVTHGLHLIESTKRLAYICKGPIFIQSLKDNIFQMCCQFLKQCNTNIEDVKSTYQVDCENLNISSKNINQSVIGGMSTTAGSIDNSVANGITNKAASITNTKGGSAGKWEEGEFVVNTQTYLEE